MEPIELTEPKAFRERLTQAGVITVTRGTFGDAVAHTTGCHVLQTLRVPARYKRFWFTPDYSSAATTLGARKCGLCLRPRRYRPPFRPVVAARVEPMNTASYQQPCKQCKGTGQNQQVGSGRPIPRACDVCKGKGYILKARPS